MTTKDDLEDKKAATAWVERSVASPGERGYSSTSPEAVKQEARIDSLAALLTAARERERVAIVNQIGETIRKSKTAVEECEAAEDVEDELLYERLHHTAQLIAARNIVRNIIEDRDGTLDGWKAVRWVKGTGLVYEETHEERARRWCLSQCAAGGHRIELLAGTSEPACDCVVSLAAEFAAVGR